MELDPNSRSYHINKSNIANALLLEIQLITLFIFDPDLIPRHLINYLIHHPTFILDPEPDGAPCGRMLLVSTRLACLMSLTVPPALEHRCRPPSASMPDEPAPIADDPPGVEPIPSVSATHRAGFVSILGVPNVGKSTLMNALVGERLSITTPKAQTTRHRIMGILNAEDYQIVYSDTPGVLLPHYKLQEGMMRFVLSSINDADVLLLVVDVFQTEFADDKVLRALRASPAALIVLVNKIDLLREGPTALSAEKRAKLGTEEDVLARWRAEFPGASVLPISARQNVGTEELFERVSALLPLHPPFFPKDQMTDKPERFFASEMLRGAIFELYSQEVPYSCEVLIGSFKEKQDIIRITAEICVGSESQKGIVIGAKGAAIKRVGIRARKRMEEFFLKKVHLETRVKVRKGWREDESALREFGYLT